MRPAKNKRPFVVLVRRPGKLPSWICRCEDCTRRRVVPFLLPDKREEKRAKEP